MPTTTMLLGRLLLTGYNLSAPLNDSVGACCYDLTSFCSRFPARWHLHNNTLLLFNTPPFSAGFRRPWQASQRKTGI